MVFALRRRDFSKQRSAPLDVWGAAGSSAETAQLSLRRQSPRHPVALGRAEAVSDQLSANGVGASSLSTAPGRNRRPCKASRLRCWRLNFLRSAVSVPSFFDGQPDCPGATRRWSDPLEPFRRRILERGASTVSGRRSAATPDSRVRFVAKSVGRVSLTRDVELVAEQRADPSYYRR